MFSFPADWTELVPQLEQHHDDNIVTKQRLGAFLGADCQRGAPPVVSALVNPDSCDVAGGANKRWVSSINFVDAAGLRPQDSAFVGLSNFPSFDRNHADEELGKLRFGFF